MVQSNHLVNPMSASLAGTYPGSLERAISQYTLADTASCLLILRTPRLYSASTPLRSIPSSPLKAVSTASSERSSAPDWSPCWRKQKTSSHIFRTPGTGNITMKGITGNLSLTVIKNGNSSAARQKAHSKTFRSRVRQLPANIAPGISIRLFSQ